MKFIDLSKEMQERVCTMPQSVFATLNPDDETDDHIVEIHEKFLKLPEKIKDKLVAPETSDKIKNVCAHYNLELLQMAPVARVIRSYYFGEVKLEDFAQIIEKESQIGKEEAQNIARYITERIISRDVEIKETVRKEKLSIITAIERYPEIKRQILSSSFLEGSTGTSSPTIENWINDYFATVGAGNRDVMKRSSYLYHSKNAKGLNSADKQKLSQILKSLDEGFLLDIDMDKREVIFKLPAVENRNNFITEINNKKDSQLMNQKMPSWAQKEETIKGAPNVAPATNKRFVDSFAVADKKEEDKIIAKQVKESVVKLRDINAANNLPNSNKKGGNFGFLAGTKKRDDFDRTEIENNKSKGNIAFFEDSLMEKNKEPKKEEKNAKRDFQANETGDAKTVIRHIRGNSWDLGSAHFLKKENSVSETGENKKTFGLFNKKDPIGAAGGKSISETKEDSVKFTSPQQLPVEKEKAKSDKFGNFFGKIKPLE